MKKSNPFQHQSFTTMIVVITVEETNEQTGRKQLLVSHGIDLRTGANVILPVAPPSSIGAAFDSQFGEFVLME